MIDTSWHLDDAADEGSARGRRRADAGPPPGLLSLDQLRATLRRRRWLPILLAVLGGVLGLAFSVLVPAKSQATVTLLLAHADGADPDVAMSTDVSLLQTTTVARQVIAELDLDETPAEFKKTYTATPTTSQVLTVKAADDGDAAAVLRAKTIAETFLSFRAEELSDQSTAVADGYREQVEQLQQQSADLSDEYDRLTAAGSADQDEAADVLDQRAKIDGQINTLQASLQDAGLQTAAVVRASHIVDPASIDPSSAVIRTGLTTVSGIIGGLAVGVLLVLLGALTTRRVRTRQDVADALGAPVRTSTGPVRRPRRIRRRLRRRIARLFRRGRPGSAIAVGQAAVDLLAAGLGGAAAPSRRAINRVALSAVDDVDVAARVLSRLAVDRTDRGDQVFLVDLTTEGRLAEVVDDALRRTDDQGTEARATPVLYRPVHAPALARGPVGEDDELTGDLLPTSPYRRAFERADLVLTLVEAGPGAELGLLHTWADRQVALVTAGTSSAERLRSTGEVLRESGVDLRFCLLAGADESDESLGLAPADGVVETRPVGRRRAGR